MGIGIPYIMPLTFSIDAITLGLKYIRDKIKKNPGKRGCMSRGNNRKVSVIIPAYNSEKSLETTVMSIYSQTLKPKNVVVIDDCSTDRTHEICQKLQLEFDNFFYLRRKKNMGKAKNINYAVKKLMHQLGSITVVVDSDILLDKECIEKMAGNFTSDDIAAVTPYGYTLPPNNPLARALHYGNSWNNEVFKIRKVAQSYRNAVSVVCGAGTAYRTKILHDLPIPVRTKTEDTDYTWVLQEHGYKIIYEEGALIHSFDSEKPSALMRQWFRWYSGTFQSIYIHGRKLVKAKKLFLTTVLPSMIESVPYALGVVTLPLVFAINVAAPGALPLFGMSYVKGFFLADAFLTIVPTAIISPKYLRYTPEIYVYKFIGSALTLVSFSKITYEKAAHKQLNWSNTWRKDSESSQKIIIRRISERYVMKNLSKFLSLEDNWTELGERPWSRDNFMCRIPGKWKLSFAATRNSAIIGYLIGSQANEKLARVNKILVDRNHRKNGIGKLLLDAFESRCLENNITQAELKALTDNPSANNFYINLGYVPCGEVKGTDKKTRNFYKKDLARDRYGGDSIDSIRDTVCRDTNSRKAGIA
ncbi:Glycosyltransferase AglI [uncultured archaeon]|nr:Glycosyltransferase AglI [uncultured archaeon]